MSDDNPYLTIDNDDQDNPYTHIDDAPAANAPNVVHASPTDGMSNTDLALAGAGKSVVDVWHGVRQLFGAPGAQEDADEAARLDKPLMKTPAGIGGYVGGSLATAVIPGGLLGDAAKGAGLAKTGAALTGIASPATYAGAAASGALQGAVQPTETGDSRMWNTIAGGALGAGGNAIARGGSAIASAVGDKLGDASSRAIKALSDAGVPLDAAQRTGSILLQRAKAMLSDNPLTAGAQKDFADMQQKAVNKAFLSTIGEHANAATPDVMNRAMSRLGNTYDDIASRTSVPYDNVEEPLSQILNSSRLRLNDQQFGTVQRNVDDILQKASQNGGVIDGDQFQNIKKTLDKLSGGGDSDVAESARDIRQAMNDGLYKSAVDAGNTKDAQLLKTTNQQWRNMRTIEGAIDKEGSGDISPARLANIMGQKANRSVSIYGQGDTTLSDLAHASNALLPNKTPNSGTASRILGQSALPIAVAGAEQLHSGDWKKAAEAGATAYALPKIIQKGLNSQGPIGKAAMNVVGTFGEKPKMDALAGGALQHLPFSKFLSGPPGTDKRSTEPEDVQ